MRRSAGGPPPTSSALFLCGGGTGGHVYPALAVAEALRGAPAGAGRAAEGGLSYVGRAGSIEERIVAREGGLPFLALPAAPLRGRGPLAAARGLATIARGTAVARRLIARHRPGAILGTGGYVCVPLFLAARTLGVPTMIYLPDVVPGLAVRFLARVADAVACNVEDSARYLRLPISDLRSIVREIDGPAGGAGPNGRSDHAPANGLKRKALLVAGYPVRAALFGQDKAACLRAFGLSDGPPTALVYGGSLGARSINRAVAALLPDLLAHCQLIHVCGREGDEAWLRTAAEGLAPELRGRYRLFPYLESDGETTMARAFGAADLAICRSGASTLAELPAAALPAVLVPYPFVHQDENADYLARHGAALKVDDGAMIAGDDPRRGALYPAVVRLLNDEHERARMAARSRALARPEAARHLAQALIGLATRSLS